MPKPIFFLTSAEWAAKQETPISTRRTQVLCKTGRIKGARKIGRDYLIPENAKDPRRAVGRNWGESTKS